MTRWPKLYELLTGKPALTETQRRFAELKALADDRYARNDTRGYGRACMELEQVQRERLRLGQ
jgi:hypothetical protein